MLTTWTVVGLALVALGGAISSTEELISHRRTAIVLGQSKQRSQWTVAVSLFVIASSVVAIGALACSPRTDNPFLLLGLGALAIGLVLRWGVAQGLDGSDRMLQIAGIGVFSWVALSPISELLGNLAWAPLFILVAWAYFESGWAKVTQAGWRNGRQLALTLNMKEFGNKLAARALMPRPVLAAIASWGVMSLELLAGPLLLIGGWVSVLTAVALTIMHATIAVLMGLGRFFCPFVGALCFLVATQPW